MNLTRDHIERLIIDRIILASPEGERASHSNKAGAGQHPYLTDHPHFFRLAQDELRLTERLPHALLKPVATRIKHIAERYTNLRGNTIPALSAEEALAYASYYLIINLEKLARLLKIDPEIASIKNLNVLDYGCGPGTGSLALSLVREDPFTVTALDSNRAMRDVAQKLLYEVQRSKVIERFEVVTQDDPLRGPYHLIIVGHVLNEMPGEEQEQLLKRLTKMLTPNGMLLLLESALPEQTRQLMARRNFLLSSYPDLRVLFPCTHQNQCPMLTASLSDWCHGSMHWNPPHLIRQLDQLTGFNKHELKYSCVIFKKGLEAKSESRKHYRVVAPSEQNKSGHTLSLCGPDFFGSTLLRKRDRSDANLEFRRAEHFDILTADGPDAIDKVFPPSLAVVRERAI